MPIKVVIFDLDDTLIVDEAITKEAFEATAAEAVQRYGVERATFLLDLVQTSRTLWESSAIYPYCVDIGVIDHECLWGDFAGDKPETRALREWAFKFRIDLFDTVLRRHDILDEEAPEQLSEAHASSRRKLLRLMPDAKETLVRLHGTRRLALLTNGDSSVQREKLTASGLAHFFDAVAVSGEVGVGKPNPAIFHSLLDGMGIHPGEAVMVGNSLKRDILGAKNAGIAAAIWLRVAGSEEFADVEPDRTIDGLHELPDLIGQLD